MIPSSPLGLNCDGVLQSLGGSECEVVTPRGCHGGSGEEWEEGSADMETQIPAQYETTEGHISSRLRSPAVQREKRIKHYLLVDVMQIIDTDFIQSLKRSTFTFFHAFTMRSPYMFTYSLCILFALCIRSSFTVHKRSPTSIQHA